MGFQSSEVSRSQAGNRRVKGLALVLLLAAFLVSLAAYPVPVVPGTEVAGKVEAGGNRQTRVDWIRVGLKDGVATVKVGAPGGYRLLDEAGKVVFEGRDEVPVTVQVSGASLQIGGGKDGLAGTSYQGALTIEPLPGRSDGDGNDAAYIQVDGVKYRGQVEVFPGPRGLVVVNTLPLEEYLYGVVPREMPADWPAEALKAQAVAARTYALYVKETGKYRGRGFDISADRNSQVYGGVAAESQRVNELVDSTRGEVLTYQGRLINAVFHSSSGGHTENAENVWTWPLPYLRGVPDYDQESPHYRWKVSFELPDLGRALREAGYDTGEFYGLTEGPRGVSGRLVSVVLEGSRGRINMDADTFRWLFNLKSTLFDIRELESEDRDFTRALNPVQEVSTVGAGNRTGQARLASSWVLGARGGLRKTTNPVAVGHWWLPKRFELVGRGWGHGLGMSQWGARALARNGHNYREILEYYYQDAVLARWYEEG